MENYLPLFPLNLVAFPGEELNLHIFEDRYKQLISECLELKASFGIPSYVKTRIEYGTEVKIEDVVKNYEDGRMDITTRALRVFKVMNFTDTANGKLYAGGDVSYLENVYDEDYSTRYEMISLIKELYQAIDVVKEVEVAEDISSFDIGHKVGFSLEEEYQLLQIEREIDRQEFIIQHLKKTIPVLKEVERTKERIRMNGHFKHFDPLDF